MDSDDFWSLFWIAVFFIAYIAIWFVNITVALVLTVVWAVLKLSEV